MEEHHTDQRRRAQSEMLQLNSITLRKSQSANASSLLTKTSSSFAPITAHYSLNTTLYTAFYRLCEKKHYRTALAIGIQFCKVALFDIPLHSYYNSPKYADMKIESSNFAIQVSDLLPTILSMAEKESKRDGIPFDMKEKREEVLTLRDIARDHYHQLVYPSQYFEEEKQYSNNNNEKSLSISTKIREIHPDHGDGWSWDCGVSNLSLDICPDHSQGLPIVEEDQDFDDFLENGERPPQSMNYLNVNEEKSHSFGSIESDASHRMGHSSPLQVNEPRNQYLDQEAATNETSKEYSHKSRESLQFDADLKRALYLSGLEIQHTPERSTHEERYSNLKPVGSDIVEFHTLAELYKDDFIDLLNSANIQINYVDTYQGRVRGSLNGCTVIAPLLAIHHLCSDLSDEILSSRNAILTEGFSESERLVSENIDETSSTLPVLSMDGSLHDDLVRVVIDIQAPKVLTLVRQSLNLHPDALIIPSDVHDFLIQHNMLQQNQFIDVFGGNILDDDHVSTFISKLSKVSEDDTNKKVAATFFFHEHVISLHRVTKQIYTSIQDGGTGSTKKSRKKIFRKFRKTKGKSAENADFAVVEEEVWFELIDSLPGKKMLNIKEGISDCDAIEVTSTARIRCKNVKSLQACIRWYACSKLNPMDEKFIDAYQFDSCNMDFDPRIFQAFIFMEGQ
jgi:hypothetical protein